MRPEKTFPLELSKATTPPNKALETTRVNVAFFRVSNHLFRVASAVLASLRASQLSRWTWHITVRAARDGTGGTIISNGYDGLSRM